MTETRPPVAAAAGEEAEPYRWRWYALAVILAAEVMDLLDSTVVGIAAPSIRGELGGTYTSIQWLAAGYTLTFAIGLITGGRLGDIYGRRRVFIVGVAGFTVVSGLCGLAPTVGSLIGLRLLQGAFAAVMIPQGFGIIKSTFPPRELPSAFGFFGPVIGLSAVLGPIVAGSLISANLFGTEWRMVFLINVPIGIIAFVGALRFLPESRSSHPLHLDLVGMVLVMVGTVLLVYPLVQGRDLGWPAWSFVMMAASVPVLGLFGWYEVRKQRRDGSALVVPSLFRDKTYVSGLLVMLIFFGAMAGFILIFGLFLQIGLGFSALRAGLTLAPFAFGLAAGSAASGAVLARRYGRRVLHSGVTVMAIGVLTMYATLGRYGSDVSSLELLPGLILAGIGMGLLLSPLFSFVLGDIGQDDVGSASGVLNANQQLGSTIGVAVIGTIFFALLAGGSSSAIAGLHPTLQERLAAQGVPVSAQTAIVEQFTTCAHDTAEQQDPSAVPASCTTTATASSARAGVGAALGQAGRDVRGLDFTDAMRTVLLVVVGLLLAVYALAFLLPRRLRTDAMELELAAAD